MPIGKMITAGVIFLILVILGVLLWCGKGAWLIAGYNTSSKAEKSKYDEKALCRFVAKIMFAMAVFMLLLFSVENMVAHLSLSLLAVVCIFGAVIYANTGNRFKKK